MQLFFFRLYLVLHACAARFDVTGAQNFLNLNGPLAQPEVPAGGVDCDASAWIDSDILKDRGWR